MWEKYLNLGIHVIYTDISKKHIQFIYNLYMEVFMKNLNITKIDSKGRILIPVHIRNFLKVESGADIVFIPDNETNQLKILPLVKEKTAEFKFVLSDSPGSLASIAEILAKHSINIIISESRSIDNQIAEWNVIADTSDSSLSVDEVKEISLNSGFIKNVEVLKR